MNTGKGTRAPSGRWGTGSNPAAWERRGLILEASSAIHARKHREAAVLGPSPTSGASVDFMSTHEPESESDGLDALAPTELRTPRRPVYVLGAGFSRAISDLMPLTDDLGNALRERLGLNWSMGQQVSFEERLTVLSTALPVLQAHENTRRRAEAEALTAAIADVLDGFLETVTGSAPPLWLLQLVAIWHAEQAVVITFNYDTLVESAFGALGVVKPHYDNGVSYELDGKQIVYPAPRSSGSGGWQDAIAADDSSFQLLKLHGSLSWYWSSGDGSTVVQDRALPTFGRATSTTPELSGIKTLDRFLIPPVLSKDSYYNVNIAHMLWRTAHDAVANASRLTILGYSLPAGDRITAELLRMTPKGTPVDIVNRDIGEPQAATSPLGRATTLGFQVNKTWNGDRAIPAYVRDRLLQRYPGVFDALADYEDEPLIASVSLRGTRDEPATFMLRSVEEGNDGVDIDLVAVGNASTPPHVTVGARMPSFAGADDFHTAKTLKKVVSKSPFRVNLAGRMFVAIGAKGVRIGRWEAVELQLAPAE